jgi:hypothetical protein
MYYLQHERPCCIGYTKFKFIKKIGRKFLVWEACCQEEKFFIKAVAANKKAVAANKN